MSQLKILNPYDAQNTRVTDSDGICHAIGGGCGTGGYQQGLIPERRAQELTVFNGDCLEILKTLPSESVDLVVADPPYAVTKNEWDKEIPLEPLWAELKRVSKGAIILFGQGLFSAKLIMSNPKMYKYTLIWDKVLISGFLNAKRMPLRKHEDILVFYEKPPTYNPQKVNGNKNHGRKKVGPVNNRNYGDFNSTPSDESGMKYPTSIVTFSKPHASMAIHPTEKPVELMEWLVKTYSNEGDTVLDFCMGCGSTGVACRNTDRHFIGIELDKSYFNIAKGRIFS